MTGIVRTIRLWMAALLPAAAGTIVGCGPPNVFQSPPDPEVTVARPIEQSVVDYVEFTGTTMATSKVDLRARVNGYLERIKFEDGARVSEGELLFVIERAPFETAVKAANANLQKAQATLELAQAQSIRTAELFRKKVSTQNDVDIKNAELATAKANVSAVEAALAQAELDLKYTEIRAPIAGRISRHLVDVGDLVQSQQMVLATIQSIDPIHAYFHVSEGDLLHFMEMRRQNKLPDPEKVPPALQLQLANESDFPHQGHLDYRELGVDPNTGTILRRGIFPNPDLQLIPGLFVRIRAPMGEASPRLMVEERAVGTDQRGDFLLVVNDKNVVEYRPAKLGLSMGGKRVVESGVKATDWVIVNGLQRARPGTSVTPQRVETVAVAQPASVSTSSASKGERDSHDATAAADPAGSKTQSDAAVK